MTDAERINEALNDVVNGGAGRVTALLLMPPNEELQRPALCFRGEDLDALGALGLARWEDREDGRHYALTAFGLKVQAELLEMCDG